MRYGAHVDAALSSVSLTVSETCYTDSLPLIPQLFFNNAEFDISSNVFALASVILTRDYCGEIAEFASPGVGVEFARAMGIVCAQILSVTPIKGLDRAHSTAELDIVCAPARLNGLDWAPRDGVPPVLLDWSGDFIAPGTRSSEGFRQGHVFTNAGLIASEAVVSIAIGLMHGGGLCRNLVVPFVGSAETARLEPVRRALDIVGIALSFAPAR